MVVAVVMVLMMEVSGRIIPKYLMFQCPSESFIFLLPSVMCGGNRRQLIYTLHCDRLWNNGTCSDFSTKGLIKYYIDRKV